ncbi:hypothetical protein HF325_005284 [Metschnikowia pulcherrima]|uniref:Uncharacterized protein n=1 Tax=Metschnikowia pulcherrima TaxID=27326 RepID=A0A8H7GNP8_9ASCO|nr:hypothetical protein HF325_005284 [Metschnikowia pulcherrima]
MSKQKLNKILDLENVADDITDEIQSSNAKTSISCGTADLQESEMYHGVMVKPLSSFGEFETDLDSQDWPWVCDRTSGEVHKDMETVSELYNQELNMRSVALNYVIELQEDLRWGEMKDIFYELYPRRVQARAFAALEKLTKLEALRIISGETLTFTHETILKPMNDIVCNDDTAKRINREIETMRGIAERAMQQAREALALAQKEIYGYNIYTFDEFLLMEHYTRGHSPLGKTAIKKLQLYKIRYIEARIFAFQLEQSFVRYEKRTQWIHMTTSPIPPSDEADLLFAQLDRLSKLHDMPFRGTCEDKETPYPQQMEALKVSLRVFGTGVLREFDSLHNSEWFQAYDFWVTYERCSPKCVPPFLGIHLTNFRQIPATSLYLRRTFWGFQSCIIKFEYTSTF